MKGLILVFVMLMWSGYGRAQELRTGNYPDGSLRFKGYFKDGKPSGEMTHYFPSGKIKAQMNHRGDTADVVLYHPETDFTSAGRYVNRKKEGKWTYRKGGRIVAEEMYGGDRLDGQAVFYTAGGEVLEQKQWKDGTPEGEWKLFWGEGKLRLEACFKAGKLEGPVKSYSREGILQTEGTYRNDLKEGEWLFFDAAGKESRKLVYHKGLPENAGQLELEESRRLDSLVSTGKKIPDPAVFADDPEAYMKITGME